VPNYAGRHSQRRQGRLDPIVVRQRHGGIQAVGHGAGPSAAAQWPINLPMTGSIRAIPVQ
jgi:hypothetical protein